MAAVKEMWKPIRGYEGCYEIGSLGRVKSLARIASNGHILPEKILKARYMTNGYLAAMLWKNGSPHTVTVHRLVLEAFVGPRPPGKEALHSDGDRSNASLSNLRWGTKEENLADKKRHGKMTRGIENGSAKFYDGDFERVRDLRTQGVSFRAIQRWLGVSAAHACNFMKGKDRRFVLGA